MTDSDPRSIPSEIGPYVLSQQIGSGTFASVWKGRHKILGNNIAIKAIPKNNLTDSQKVTRFAREVNLLKQMDHPMISQLYSVMENDHYHFLIMEYVENGDLLSFVNKNGKLIDPIARRYFMQLISVLEYLHKEKKIAHRDLKAENIMLDRYYNIRVIDFGLSNSFSDEKPDLNTACGSPAYVPPEMIKGQPYTSAADIWSAGILLYAITVGKLPFEDRNMQTMLHYIVNAKPVFPPFISSALADLITKMLIKNPQERITLDRIKEHPWFSPMEYNNIISFSKKSLELPDGKLSLESEYYCDPEIVPQMSIYGIDTSLLKQKLLLSEYDETTAIYRILKREKLTEDMKNISRNKIDRKSTVQNATPQPSQTTNFINIPSAIVAKQGTTRRIMKDNIPNPAIPIAIPTPRIVTARQNNERSHSVKWEQKA